MLHCNCFPPRGAYLQGHKSVIPTFSRLERPLTIRQTCPPLERPFHALKTRPPAPAAPAAGSYPAAVQAPVHTPTQTRLDQTPELTKSSPSLPRSFSPGCCRCKKAPPPPASAAALVHSKLHLAVLGGGARRLLHIGPGLEDLPPALACWRIVRLPVCLRLLRPVFLVLPLPLKVLACHTERGKALRISRIALHLVSCRSVLQNTEERISDSQNCMAPCELQECIPKHSRNVGFGVSQSRDVGISSTRKHSEHSGLLCGLDGKRMRRPV